MWHYNLFDNEFLSLFVLQSVICPLRKEIRVGWLIQSNALFAAVHSFFWHPNKFHPRTKKAIARFLQGKLPSLAAIRNGGVVHNMVHWKSDIQILSLVVSLVVWSDAEEQVFTVSLERGKILVCFRGGNKTGENMFADGWVVSLDY